MAAAQFGVLFVPAAAHREHAPGELHFVCVDLVGRLLPVRHPFAGHQGQVGQVQRAGVVHRLHGAAFARGGKAPLQRQPFPAAGDGNVFAGNGQHGTGAYRAIDVHPGQPAITLAPAGGHRLRQAFPGRQHKGTAALHIPQQQRRTAGAAGVFAGLPALQLIGSGAQQQVIPAPARSRGRQPFHRLGKGGVLLLAAVLRFVCLRNLRPQLPRRLAHQALVVNGQAGFGLLHLLYHSGDLPVDFVYQHFGTAYLFGNAARRAVVDALRRHGGELRCGRKAAVKFQRFAGVNGRVAAPFGVGESHRVAVFQPRVAPPVHGVGLQHSAVHFGKQGVDHRVPHTVQERIVGDHQRDAPRRAHGVGVLPVNVVVLRQTRHG